MVQPPRLPDFFCQQGHNGFGGLAVEAVTKKVLAGKHTRAWYLREGAGLTFLFHLKFPCQTRKTTTGKCMKPSQSDATTMGSLWIGFQLFPSWFILYYTFLPLLEVWLPASTYCINTVVPVWFGSSVVRSSHLASQSLIVITKTSSGLVNSSDCHTNSKVHWKLPLENHRPYLSLIHHGITKLTIVVLFTEVCIGNRCSDRKWYYWWDEHNPHQWEQWYQ